MAPASLVLPIQPTEFSKVFDARVTHNLGARAVDALQVWPRLPPSAGQATLNYFPDPPQGAVTDSAPSG